MGRAEETIRHADGALASGYANGTGSYVWYEGAGICSDDAASGRNPDVTLRGGVGIAHECILKGEARSCATQGGAETASYGVLRCKARSDASRGRRGEENAASKDRDLTGGLKQAGRVSDAACDSAADVTDQSLRREALSVCGGVRRVALANGLQELTQVLLRALRQDLDPAFMCADDVTYEMMLKDEQLIAGMEKLRDLQSRREELQRRRRLESNIRARFERFVEREEGGSLKTSASKRSRPSELMSILKEELGHRLDDPDIREIFERRS